MKYLFGFALALAFAIGCKNGPYDLAPDSWKAHKFKKEGFLGNPDFSLKMKYPPTWIVDTNIKGRIVLNCVADSIAPSTTTINIGNLVRPASREFVSFVCDLRAELGIGDLSYTVVNGAQTMVYARGLPYGKFGKFMFVNAGEHVVQITVSSYDSTLLSKKIPIIDSILQTMEW